MPSRPRGEPTRPRGEPTRHRTKPKFDIPAQTEPVETPAGWVYRGEAEEPSAAPPKPSADPEPAETTRNPFLMVGEGLALVGIGSMILTYRATLGMMGMIAMPIRLLRRD